MNKKMKNFTDTISYKNIKKNNFFLDNLNDLEKGQALVHLDHGVGRYVGLKILNNNNINNEYLVLKYANNAILYVPIYSLNLIKKYINIKNKKIPLDSLGCNKWIISRKKAILKIKDIAAELLKIYALRFKKIGFSFKLNEKKYRLFCKNFKFNLTKDQKITIDNVFEDMMNSSPMDRLICGDVGFGKTEIAMRAAFLALINKKQVAVLTPTTLLTQQHFDNFKKRFANFEYIIEMLSRFRSIKEEKKILKEISSGYINIIIGTHKILKKNICWKNLGLLIIDEEHRFGVKQKDQIKKISPNIDILTLTATPIPRTLNLAIQGMRDLSIIQTPPAHRLEIKTYICEHNVKIIRKAILREIKRNGQVYYLYNDIKNIHKIKRKLSNLIPEAKIAVGHGKMKEKDLENIMNDFYHNKFNVLICSTIIETGLDVSNANTIIIERADKFGLAQLHQLRGRVGRSYYQAYAWLLIPNNKLLNEDAKKRLEAISDLGELGAGFTIALQDLEIRGAGEILGKEQSGQIQSVGYATYMDMLEKAIISIEKNENIENIYSDDDKSVSIEISVPSILPETFISNVNCRIDFYKKISNAKNKKELYKIKHKIIKKFGILPSEVNNLLDLNILRILSNDIKIKKIQYKEKKKYGLIEFKKNCKINYNVLIDLIQKKPNQWKIEKRELFFFKNLSNIYLRIKWITDFLYQIKEK